MTLPQIDGVAPNPWGIGFRSSRVGETEPYGAEVQGYLAHKKHLPPRILQEDYTRGPTVVLGGGAVPFERDTPAVGVPVQGTGEPRVRPAPKP